MQLAIETHLLSDLAMIVIEYMTKSKNMILLEQKCLMEQLLVHTVLTKGLKITLSSRKHSSNFQNIVKYL